MAEPGVFARYGFGLRQTFYWLLNAQGQNPGHSEALLVEYLYEKEIVSEYK